MHVRCHLESESALLFPAYETHTEGLREEVRGEETGATSMKRLLCGWKDGWAGVQGTG